MVNFRDAVAADVPVIHAMLQGLAAHDGAVLRATEADLVRDGFGPRPVFQAVLAEEAGVALGMVIFYPDYSSLRGRPGVLVQDLYVTDAARGRGVGRKLLGAALEAGAAWNASFLTLMVDRGNTVARRFYSGQGFTNRGEYDVLIAEGADFRASDPGA